ncbi:MAG: cupin domain-containing protein [Gemmatimonadota bacterium]|nr:cupin domain-containing protein [Gemmatimonadota bacterium]
MDVINLREKLSSFDEYWSPRIVGELNGQYVKLAKLQGRFVWHHHASEDELFLVLKGRLTMEFRDRTVTLGEGECLIVPRGVEHRPSTNDEVHVLLFEPITTVNTGNVRNGRTIEVPKRA